MLNGSRAVILLAAVVAVLVTGRLGFWQLDRAAQKVALHDAMQRQRALPPLSLADAVRDPTIATTQQHRALVLRGNWMPAATVYLDNRPMDGRAGFYALTPLRLADGSAVLVQRGWLPRDVADRTRISAAPPPAGEVDVQGRIAPGPSRLYEFAGAASGPIRQNLELDAYARETGLPLRPFMVVQEDGATPVADGLQRRWPQPAADVHKHYGYAFQWFAMSTLVGGLYAWFQLIRPARRRLAARRA
jgi:surfeit locus 1 family protein